MKCTHIYYKSSAAPDWPYSLRPQAAEVDKKQSPPVPQVSESQRSQPAILPVSKADLLLSQKEKQHS